MASVIVNGNGALVDLTTESSIRLTVTSNSQNTQKVTVKGGGNVDFQFSGSGERNVLGQTAFTTNSPMLVNFQWSPPRVESYRDSVVRSGGPYSIGKSNFVILVAENGDDNDFNDTVVQFSWGS